MKKTFKNNYRDDAQAFALNEVEGISRTWSHSNRGGGVKHLPKVDVQAVALKAFDRVAKAWSLTSKEAAALTDMSESTWKRARKPGFADDLTPDQMTRLSALVGLYKSLELYFTPATSAQWVKQKNTGPEFDGQRPVDAMIEGGLSKIRRVRIYVDALRGGF